MHGIPPLRQVVSTTRLGDLSRQNGCDGVLGLLPAPKELASAGSTDRLMIRLDKTGTPLSAQGRVELSCRPGVHSSTAESWRQDALAGVEQALRCGSVSNDSLPTTRRAPRRWASRPKMRCRGNVSKGKR